MQAYKSWISFKEEATYDTDPGGARDGYARVITDGLTAEENPQDYPGLGSRDVRGIYHGHKIVGGDVEPLVTFEGGWLYLLKHAFGDYTFTADDQTTGANKHEFEMLDDLPTGLAIESCKADVPTGDAFLYTGCKVNNLALSLDAEGLLRCVASIIGATETPDGAIIASPTYPADKIVKFSYTSNLTVAGSSIDVKNFSLAVNNGLERRFLLSRTTKEPLPNAKRILTGSAVAEFEDLTHYNKYKAETEGAFTVVLTSTEMAAGTEPFKITLYSAASHLIGGTPTIQGDGVVELPLSWRMIGTSDSLKATIINTQATL